MKTAKELIEEMFAENPKKLEGPFRIAINGLIPIDPSKPITREQRQAIQTRAEDDYLSKHPGGALVRTVIPEDVDDELTRSIMAAMRKGVEMAMSDA